MEIVTIEAKNGTTRKRGRRTFRFCFMSRQCLGTKKSVAPLQAVIFVCSIFPNFEFTFRHCTYGTHSLGRCTFILETLLLVTNTLSMGVLNFIRLQNVLMDLGTVTDFYWS